jgi:hypothetical protein
VRAAFSGALAPDGYGRLELPGETISFLLELDRATEPHKRLEEKARRYARELARSDLAQQQPLVLLLVPTAARAQRAAASLANYPVHLRPLVWTPETGGSPLALLRAQTRDRHAT